MRAQQLLDNERFWKSSVINKKYLKKTEGETLAEFTVNSTICGFTHKIRGTLKGASIIVDIESPCGKVKKMSHLEVPMMEIMDIKDNYVMEKAQEAGCSSNCLVPCAVLNLCKLESGFIAKSLAQKSGSISIDFDEV